MGTAQATPSIDVSSTRVFDYRREVIVELHGRTVDGEFEVVSYAFRHDQDGETRLSPTDVANPHEEIVREKLAEAGYAVD